MKPSTLESYSDYIQWNSGENEDQTVPPAYPFRAIMVNYLSSIAYNITTYGVISIEYLTNSEETRVIEVGAGVNLPSGPFIRSRLLNISGKKILSITANSAAVSQAVQFTLLI